MARSQCPSTPFSTPLSGSARQAEARIRNLFQGPKRRPPVWLMALTLLLIFSCGGLVTCRTAASPPPEEGAPVFSLTTPGKESVPFSDLLGFSGTAFGILNTRYTGAGFMTQKLGIGRATDRDYYRKKEEKHGKETI